MDQKRYISETGQEQRIAAIIEPVVRDLGFRLVRVRVTAENGCTLQIMAEDEQGAFTIDQCQQLSQEISPLLDVEEPISGAYHLEVSSPGIDRPLVRRGDFERWQGHEARIELARMRDGRKRFRGTLAGLEGEQLILQLPDVPEGADSLVRLDLSMIGRARLVLTDRLLAEAAASRSATPPGDPDVETIIENDATPEPGAFPEKEKAGDGNDPKEKL
ncbi:MAG TPA: ribosome maturation factor RimP [Devosia sp.]|nr:ribosome maturation factor RimP [Devosia sp.]